LIAKEAKSNRTADADLKTIPPENPFLQTAQNQYRQGGALSAAKETN
jgi:hypothetical protein